MKYKKKLKNLEARIKFYNEQKGGYQQANKKPGSEKK